MKFGMPALIEAPKIEECAMICRKLGLQFVELNMNLPEYQPEAIDVPYFQAVAEEYGIFYTIHLDENLNVSDFNPHVAEAYLRTVFETIEIARKLCVPMLNMHLSAGVYFTLPEQRVYLFDVYREMYLTSIHRFRERVESAVGDTAVKLCVENCGGYTAVQREAIALLLESSVFGLTFDIGHNACAKGADEPFILEHRDRLFHMHLHDARPLEKKDHLALGTGDLDLGYYLELAKDRNCSAVLETKTVAGLEHSVRWMAAYS